MVRGNFPGELSVVLTGCAAGFVLFRWIGADPERAMPWFEVGACVLALLLERVVELRVGQTWRTIRHRLQQVKVVTYERDGVEVRQTTEPDEEAAKILKALQVAAPPRYHAITAGKQAFSQKAGASKP